MTREEMVAFFTRHQDAMSRHDVTALADDYAEDCVVESPWAGTVTGREAIEGVHRKFLASFPDLKVHGEELLIDGHRAVLMLTFDGTDIGGFMGLPPTGKQIRIPILHLYTLKDHLIVSERRIYDFTGLLVQIGVLKAKPA